MGISLKYLVECIKLKILTKRIAGKDLKNVDFSYIAGEDVKWYSHFGKHFDSLLQSLTYAYLVAS